MSIALPLVHILMMKQDTFRRFFFAFLIFYTKKNERIFSNENNKKSLYGVLIEILSCDEEKNFLATSEDQRAVNILLQSDSRQRHECGNVMKDKKKWRFWDDDEQCLLLPVITTASMRLLMGSLSLCFVLKLDTTESCISVNIMKEFFRYGRC